MLDLFLTLCDNGYTKGENMKSKTRKYIIEHFINGFKQAYEDARYASIKPYSVVPSFYIISERSRKEAAKMVQEGLAVWLDDNTIGVSGKGRKEFFTADVIASLQK